MTASDTFVKDVTPRNQYTASSNQTDFPYDFVIFDKEDLTVFETTDPGTNSESTTTLTEGSDYTVDGVGDEDGGKIVLTSGADEDDRYTIIRNTTIERLTDFLQSGDYQSNNVNLELDTIITILQEKDLNIDRAATLKDGSSLNSIELPDASPGSAIGWNESGDGLANVENTVHTEDVSLSGGSTKTINHQLDQKYVAVQFYDSNDEQATLGRIKLVDKNNVEVESSVSVSGTVVVTT